MKNQGRRERKKVIAICKANIYTLFHPRPGYWKEVRASLVPIDCGLGADVACAPAACSSRLKPVLLREKPQRLMKSMART